MLVPIAIVILLLGSGGLAALIAWASREDRTSSAGRPYLRVWSSGRPPWGLAVAADRVVAIGRDASNSLGLDDPLVSRQHARVFFDGASWVVEDTRSANGTFVNQRPVARCALLPGDTLQIGSARLELQHEQRSAAVAPAPAEGGERGRMRTTGQYAVGPFTIVGSLGDGGIGRVLLAEDERRPDRLVALKLLHKQNHYLLKKFQQEGALRLDHPHITRVLETGEIAGHAYILQEYVEGISLRRLLTGQPWSADAALTLIGQVLQALDYAHRRQIIHRDIKPENIMISARQGVKIIDFGIAKDLTLATHTQHMLLGTPQYMSYEQALGLPVDATSDLYATAIVLYELLTGAVPFGAPEAFEVIWQHQNAAPLPPRQLNPAISPWVEEAILRALAKDRRLRFQTAAELAAALGCPQERALPPALSAEIARSAQQPYGQSAGALS